MYRCRLVDRTRNESKLFDSITALKRYTKKRGLKVEEIHQHVRTFYDKD